MEGCDMKVRDVLAVALVTAFLSGAVVACNDSDAEPTDDQTTPSSPSPTEDELSRDEAVSQATSAIRRATKLDIDTDRRRGTSVDHEAFEAVFGEPLLTTIVKDNQQLAGDIVARGTYRMVSMEPIAVAPSLGEVRMRVCIDSRGLRYIHADTGENALEGAPNPGFFISTDVVRQHGDHWTVDDRLDITRGATSCKG
jgi:hypothetical protein